VPSDEPVRDSSNNPLPEVDTGRRFVAVAGAPSKPGQKKEEQHLVESISSGTFRKFCGTNQELDGMGFVRLCRDCGLLDSKFTATDADLAFAKIVTKSHRRMSLAQFESAVQSIAEKKSMSRIAVHLAIRACAGPRLRATRADAVRFHDEVSLYTGTQCWGLLNGPMGKENQLEGTERSKSKERFTF
jgi:hypothetical protein